MIKGWKKLSKAQLEHLKFHNANSTIGFQKTIDQQAKWDRDRPGSFSCFECRAIARILDMKADPDRVWRF